MPPAPPRPAATLIAAQTRPRDAQTTAQWGPVVTHTHLLRSHRVPAEQVPDLIVRWTADHGIRAFGAGSPWEPESAAAYGRCEGPDRDRYGAGLVDAAACRCDSAVRGLIEGLNRRGKGACCFYLDNETPKARYGHLWYFGWEYLHPAWHDYCQGRAVRFNSFDAAETNPLTGQPHRRRAYLDVVHEQRRHGALAVWAHPTSWWREDGRFITNIASEAPLHLFADGWLDGLAVMGYDACHRSYQALWFHLLDTGATVPGFAETDACFDGGQRTAGETVLASRFPLGDEWTLPRLVAAARQGRSFASSGPHLTIAVDGVPMGGRVPTTGSARHRVRVEAWPEPGGEGLARIELVGRGGVVLASAEDFPGGILEWSVPGDDAPGWLLARCWGAGEDPAARQQAIRHFAITNPVYLAHGAPFAPVRGRCRLRVGSGSPWAGGRARFTDPDGLPLAEAALRAGAVIDEQLPANVRVELSNGAAHESFPMTSEDRRVQTLLRHLWEGRFLDGRPDLVPGEVPVEAFNLPALREALADLQADI